MHASGALRRENAKACLQIESPTVVARGRRAIQYSEASVMESKSRGVRDTPHARGLTGYVWSGCLDVTASQRVE
jgi:hypothetical protein